MDIIYSFEKNTALFLKEIGICLDGKKILVAFSGGADSLSLLLCLSALAAKCGFSVCAVHINHGIRGDEALADERFCRELCCRKGIELYVYSADIPKMAAESKQSLESCGRDYRYSVFERLCAEKGIDYIATAHNANDNAETVLYNLLRGSGADGLCGIPKRRGNIIRPILWATRSIIEEYLEAMGERYVTDSTNADNCYTRNYIRNVILPSCCRVNFDAINAINRASGLISADCEYLDEVADGVTENLDLNALPAAVKGRVVKNRYKKLYGGSLEQAHVIAVTEALSSSESKSVSLPLGVRAETYGGALRFVKEAVTPDLERTGLVPGENLLCGGKVRVFLGECGDNMVRIKNDVAVGELFARKRHAGDKITVRGMSRSIKKCFIDKKIPPYIRDIIPIICDGEGIIYVPFVGVADRAYPKKSDGCFGIGVTIDERFGSEK